MRLTEGAAIECVLDTGFDGSLMLPRAFVAQTEISIFAELTFEMVGGATMWAEVGLVTIDWLGGLRQVEVIVSEGDDALIGTELLIGSTLNIDYPLSSVAITTSDA